MDIGDFQDAFFSKVIRVVSPHRSLLLLRPVPPGAGTYPDLHRSPTEYLTAEIGTVVISSLSGIRTNSNKIVRVRSSDAGWLKYSHRWYSGTRRTTINVVNFFRTTSNGSRK